MSAWPGFFVIGLTGNLAAGKNAVRRVLEGKGALGIDADALYHRAILAGAPGYRPVLDAFGKFILNASGEIDRKKLGQVVLADPEALKRLKSILHPLVRRAIDRMVRKGKRRVVVIEAAKLHASPLRQACDVVWVVTAGGAEQTFAADTVIDNSGSLEETRQQVRRAWTQLPHAVGQPVPRKPRVQPKPSPAGLHVTRGSRFAGRAQAAWRHWRGGLQTFARHPMGKLGVAILVLFALLAIAHPLLLGTVWKRGIYHPITGFDMAVAPWPSGPTLAHPFGNDAQGRDILSMLMAAIPPTFAVAIAAALATLVLATAIGALSAYFRGPVDAIFYNISSALYLIPALVVIAILASRFYSQIGAWEFGLIYGVLVGGGSAAIVMRSHAMSLMNRAYVDASRVAGAGAWRIISRHLLPHLLPLAVVQMMLAVVGAVVADGFMAFYGFGDTRFNWGQMVYNGIQFLTINPKIPWLQILAPTAALSLFAAAFYMISRALQDLSDPRLADSRELTR
ncbi:MAG: dephospho-CoA kinase [Anaerolineales bacterium]